MVKRWPVVAFVMLVTLGLSACGRASGNRAPTSKVVLSAAKVYELTMGANSADFRLEFAMAPSNLDAGISSTESGNYSWATDQGTVTITGADSGLYAIKTQEIVDGNDTYTKLLSKSGPESSVVGLGLNPGTGWTESTVSGDTQSSLANLFSQGFVGLMGGSLAQLNVVNPVGLLAILQSGSGDVTDLGNETETGIATTHYRTLVPLSRLVGSGEASGPAAGLFGSSHITVDYWIDSDNRLRMLHLAITIPKLPSKSQSPAPATTTTSSSSSSGLTISERLQGTAISSKPFKFPVILSITLRLSDYGTNAQVSVPAQSEVTSHQSCTVSSSGYECNGP